MIRPDDTHIYTYWRRAGREEMSRRQENHKGSLLSVAARKREREREKEGGG